MTPSCMTWHLFVGAIKMREVSYYRSYLNLKEGRGVCTITKGVDRCQCASSTLYLCWHNQEITDARDNSRMSNDFLQLALQVSFIGCVSTRTVGGEQLKFHCCSVHHQCYVQHKEKQQSREVKGSRTGAISSQGCTPGSLGVHSVGKGHCAKIRNLKDKSSYLSL